MQENKIVLENKQIVEFYQKYTFLDVEKINLCVIGLFQDIIQKMSGELNENTKNEILSSIQSQKKEMVLLKTQLNETLKTNTDKLNNEITNTIISNFYETRKDNIRDLEFLINKNGNENLLKIIEKIENEDNKLSSKIENNQNKLGYELNNFLNQYKIGSKKGEFGEKILESILNSLFPSSEILNTTGQTSSGDFILKRDNKVQILFENKNYDSCNVSKKEVDKFLKDIKLQNCCGIMISQKTGIAQKNNFQIDIDNNNVLIYIHNMNYDPDKIMLACDIIDHLTSKINELNTGEESIHISKTVLQKISEKYQHFISKKEFIIFQLNDNTKKIIQSIKELEFEEVNTFLSNTIANQTIIVHKCEYCNDSFKSAKALSNHNRKCKKREPLQQNQIINQIINELF